MGRTTYAPPGATSDGATPESVASEIGTGFALPGPATTNSEPTGTNRLRDRSNRPSTSFDLDHRLSTFVGSLRWAAISLGLLTVAIKTTPQPYSILAGLALASFGVLQTIRPVRLDPPGASLHTWVIVESALVAAVVGTTGGFTSPFVLATAVPVVLAGYDVGRQRIAAFAYAAFVGIILVTVALGDDPASQRAVAEVGILLLLCGVLGAFTRRMVDELGRHQEAALDQVARLTTANELLVALHGVAQTLPASLDLHEVIDSNRTRLRSLFKFGSLALLVRDDTRDEWTVELAEGVRLPRQMRDDMLAGPLRAVLNEGRAVLETDLLAGPDGRGCSPMARSGIYAPLRARGSVVGLIAIEDTTPARYSHDDVSLLTSLTGPLALAVDNALWFLRLRRFGAEAERARIARDLHDRLAQSLAYTAFELERLALRAHDEDRKALNELHEVVRSIVGELRETLYQLRAGVSEDADLDRVAREYLARYEERTGLIVHWRSRVERHVPYQVEQEVWRVMQEALANVEHHAHATACAIDYQVTATRLTLIVEDDGRGFDPSHDPGGDHYGLIGMRERADALGAHLVVESQPGQGTRVSVELEVPR